MGRDMLRAMCVIFGRAPTSFFCTRLSVIPATLVEQTILSPLNCLDTLVKGWAGRESRVQEGFPGEEQDVPAPSVLEGG